MKLEVAAAWLVRMDDLRYDDPCTALAELLDNSDCIPRPLLSRYLGVCGSTYRVAGSQLSHARECIRCGIWAAEKLHDQAALADLHQRKAYLMTNYGEPKVALELARLAGGEFLALGDRVGVAKTLIDQGIFLGCQGRYREAISASKLGIEEMPSEFKRSRCAAFHSLAVHYDNCGEHDNAFKYLRLALDLSGSFGDWFQGRLLWFQGKIYFRAKLYAQAAQALAEAFALVRLERPIEASLVAIDLLWAQLRQRDGNSARRTLREIVPLVQSVGRNRVASSALMELIRIDLRSLTPILLERVREALEEAQDSANPAPFDQAAREPDAT